MKKRTKSLLAAFCTMALCGSLIAGSTYALFTDTANVNIAITSAKVDVAATVVENSLNMYSATTEAKTGDTDNTEIVGSDKLDLKDFSGTYYYKTLSTNTDENEVTTGTFTNGGSLKLEGDTITLTNITPGDKVTFSVKIQNNSNVAIQYRTVISCSGDKTLFSGLNFKVGDDDFSHVSLYKSAYKTFTNDEDNVTLDFSVELPLDAGNEYQNNKSTSITYAIEAVQYNANTSSGSKAYYEYVPAGSAGLNLTSDNLTYLTYVNGEPTSIQLTADNIDKTATEVVIPSEINGIPVTSIGENAFANLVEAPEDYLNPYTYYENNTLTSVVIPDTVTEISDNAFENCIALSSVTLGNSIKTIGESAFDNCKSLTSITLPDSLTEIKDKAFMYTEGLTSITFPASVETIGKNAFAQSGLTTVEIPSTIKNLGASVFEDCTSLTTVKINEGITTLPERIFYDCTKLETVQLPESLKEINGLAFYNNTDLTEITIPYGVESIDYMAFNNCVNLKEVSLPSSLTSIGIGAFADTSSGLTITYNGTAKDWEGVKVVYADFNVVDSKLQVNQKEVSIMNITETTNTYAVICYYLLAGSNDSDTVEETMISLLDDSSQAVVSPFYLYLLIGGGTTQYTAPVTVICNGGATIEYNYNSTSKQWTLTKTLEGKTKVVYSSKLDSDNKKYNSVTTSYTWDSENNEYVEDKTTDDPDGQ
jgi:predicted ribosomally synthesized peptide with SipW-like signal peptide